MYLTYVKSTFKALLNINDSATQHKGKTRVLFSRVGARDTPKNLWNPLCWTLRSVYFSDLIECKKYKLPHQTLIIMGEFTFVTKYYMYLCALQMHKCCHGPISAYETV